MFTMGGGGTGGHSNKRETRMVRVELMGKNKQIDIGGPRALDTKGSLGL